MLKEKGKGAASGVDLIKMLEKMTIVVCRGSCAVSGLAVILMMGLVVLNIIIRIFYKPIFGSYEMVGYLGFVICAFGLGYTHLNRAHIGVDIVTSSLRGRARSILDSIIGLLLVALSGLMTWQGVLYALKLKRTYTLSPTLGLPLYIFLLMLGFSFFVFGLVCVHQLLKAFGRLEK